ncbi:host attachment protein [Roseomonas frigidaquae]|uniref:Host attachment protein n=1 Tax=Falsiroseomonas frigidaquae TaxID=487318 RepID=A0ABX1F0S7_9PROT|nr:host attachment protein [Falsiroseomonas frigidaquae]NKE45898.1 host attachment protein [Falsiroseomonas frigidaquae]
MRTAMDWALVADGQHARVFQRPAPGGRWSEREQDATDIDNPMSHEQGRDRPGRVHESASTTRHAVEPRQDLHKAAKQAFARQLAERLEAAADEFGRVILVAPPAFLGALRDELGDATQRKPRATLDKDLTHLPLEDLVPYLDDLAFEEA